MPLIFPIRRKSRITEALRERVANEPHHDMHYQCSPHHANTAFYPITEQFALAAGFTREDTPGEKLDKLEAHLRQIGLAIPEVAPLFADALSIPTAGRYPTLDITPQRQKERTIDALAERLLAAARQRPVLVIVEDLHWSDPSSLETIGRIITQLGDARVLMVCTYRPEFEVPWGLDGPVTTLSLNRLSRSQTTALIAALTDEKSLPRDVVGQIVAKSDGVPLYVEELTKHMLESEWLDEKEDHYDLKGPLPSLSIPVTLHDALTARLDRLPEAREVAQVGAVIGREFSYPMLQSLTTLDDATLQARLTQLVEAELIYQRGRPPQAAYVFKHALIQDAAYQSLLRRTRQEHHRRIARVLEERFPDIVETQPELAAHHYTEAGQKETAIGYWQQAGEQALQRSAYKEAIGQVTKGLELIQMLSRTPEHLEQELTLQTVYSSAVVAMQGQGSHEAFAALDRARELCHQVDDPQRLFPVLRGLWMYFFQQKDSQKTSELAAQLLALAERQQDTVLRIVVYQAMGATSFWLGAFAAGRDHCARGIALYDRQQHSRLDPLYGQDPGVACLIYGAWSLWHLGYPDQALNWRQAAIDLAHDLSHPVSLSLALNTASWTHTYRREGQAAYELAEAAIDLATTHDFPHWIAMGKLMRGLALAELSRWDSAIARLQEGIEAYHATGARTRGQVVALAKAYGQSGYPEEGLHVLAEVLVAIDRMGTRQLAAEAYRIKGVLLLQQDVPDASQVQRCFRQALTTARSQQARSLELRAATSLARLSQSQDKRQAAYELLAPVYGWFTELKSDGSEVVRHLQTL